MRREILFEMRPMSRLSSRRYNPDPPTDTGSYFSNMEPNPDRPCFSRPKGASPASRARRLSYDASK